jgi:hypothetical protein
MSTNMELITSVTVGSGGAASVTLPATGTIPATYTDLKILVSARNSASSTGIEIIFNGTSSGYTMRRLYGTGSGTPASDTGGTSAFISNTMVNDSTYTANTFGNGEIYIPNYSVSGVAKSVSIDGVTENNATTALAMFTAGLSSGTGAITTIRLVASGGNFVEGSTFYLYGISKVTSTPKATGGIVSQDATYWYHTFPFTSTFTPTEAISADVLCIAGGGGTGVNFSAGAGAGGVLLFSSQSLTTTNYTVSVGSGGTGSGSGGGTNGGNSQFGSLTAAVGGGTGMWGGNSKSGGSSGGSGGGATDSITTGFAGTSGQGNAGGGASGSSNGGTGGGGGAGAAAAQATFSKSSDGGVGSSTYSSWGLATFTGQIVGGTAYFAGGGGGGSFSGNQSFNISLGGLGGGGTGGNDSGTTLPTPGLVNTGGGAGGAGANAQSGVNGGSGLVIVRYAK